MLHIGIECENLEDPKSRWGIGQITLNLLKEYADDPELQKKYKLYLYFKKKVPQDDVFKNSVFKKRVAGIPSFNVFYHIIMPIQAMLDRLDYIFFPAYQMPPLYLGKSIVLLTPDVYYEYKQGSLPFHYRLSYRIFTNWAAKFAFKILAISETSKEELVGLYGIKSEKIFVAHLGVDSQETTKYEPPVLDYVLYVGQMFPRRHARETILAFKKISSEFPNLKLVMIGRDKYPQSLIDKLIKEVNEELGTERIIHHEYIEKRENIHKLYAGAKALIYVSDREAFGLPPMEALSFGVPPVIMDSELGHELFGDYAFYCPSAKDNMLVDNIAHTVKLALTDTDKINKIRIHGPEFTKKYNWKSFTEIFFNNLK